MKYIGHRFLIGCRNPVKRRWLRRRLSLLLVCAMLLWAAVCELLLTTVQPQLIEEATRSYILSCIHQAVEEQSADFTLTASEQEDFSVLSTDLAVYAKVKGSVAEKIRDSVNQTIVVRIPLGSLLDLRVLNGRGPGVPLKLQLEGSAEVECTGVFVSAGVNQTCHRVLLNTSVTAYSQSRRFPAEVSVTTQSVLSETIIVGDVPCISWQSAGERGEENQLE